MRKESLILTVMASVIIALLSWTDSTARAATITWTNTASGAWNNPTNWNPNIVPGTNDTAIITNAGITVYLGSATTVGGIALGTFGAGTTILALNGQILTLNGPLTVYPSGSFTVDSGELAGNSNAVLSGTIGWSGGQLGGVLTLAPGSLVNLTTVNNHDLPNCTLTNYGTVTWANGNIRGGISGTAIYNYGLWDAQSDEQMGTSGYGGSAVFNNYGTFRKSGGAGQLSSATLFLSSVTFNQLAGVLDVQNGTNGLEVAFQGGGTFTGGYITTNQLGLTILSQGNFNLNGTVTGTNTWEDAGNLVGNTVINGALTWVGGTWNGAPSVTIPANSTLNVTGVSYNDMAGCIVTNYGTITWVNGTIRGGPGTAIYNYGLWDAQSDEQMRNDYGGNGTIFNNFGTFRKSGGSGEFSSATLLTSGVVYNQLAGVLEVQNSTNGLEVAFQGGGSFTGGFITTNQFGLTVLSQGNFTLNGTVTGLNTWEDAGNLSGTNVIIGGLTWVAGNWNSAPYITIASNSTLVISGGAANLDLPSCTVTNYGTVAWASGTLRLGGSPGTAIYNYGLWDAQSDQIINDAYGGSGTVFNNQGMFRKSFGTNATTVDNGISFRNTGIIGALSATLQFNSSPVLAGGTINFGIGGSNTFGRVNVPGTVNLAGGIGAVLLDGYLPPVGSLFAVMTFAATNGTFTDYSGLNAGSGVAFTPSLSSSNLTLLTVATNYTAVPPSIISQPASQTVNYGDTVTFQVTASGSPALLFQWSQNQATLAGATNATLILSNVTFAQAGAYRVSVSNSAGGVLSQVAQLTVEPVVPSFTSQPQNLTVPEGSNAFFSVTVTGEPTPVLQWLFNRTNLADGVRLRGSSTTNLSIANVRFSDVGT